MSLIVEKRLGFTMIEILTVLVIIAILSSLLLAATSGMMEKSNRDSASAEMDIIEQALEDYKERFGDYPKEGTYAGTSESLLFNALMGRVSPVGGAISVKPMLNYAPLNLSAPQQFALVTNTIEDPWGNPYRYQYKPSDTNWTSFGYLLYSEGPDGASTDSSTGVKNLESANNSDNVYAR